MVTTHIRDTFLGDKGKGTDVVTNAVWTGHIMDGHKTDRSNSLFNEQTLVFTTGNTVIENDSGYVNKSSLWIRKNSCYEIVHETSHQLGTDDHYCYGKGSNGELCSNEKCSICKGEILPECIMGKAIYPTDTYELFCNDCKTIINEHLKEHH